MNYWLLKTEADTFSIDDLAKAKRQTTFWDGVRNYQARNMLRDEFKMGDTMLLYHSNDDPPGIVGTAEVVKEASPDLTALDPQSDYFDATASAENPRWYGVEVKLKQKFAAKIPLHQLRTMKALAEMELLRKGSRLSVQRVTAAQFAAILRIAR
ncbi:MAG: EVE domain-containing protein [Pirellulaceae bacterium]